MAGSKKSTSLADVNYSLHGDNNQFEQEQIHVQQSAFALQEAAPITPQQYLIYKLVNSKTKGRVYIDGIDDAVNPKTGKMERIWLLDGAPSIWSSDLTELLKDKDYVRQNRKSLEFQGGILRVSVFDERVIEFIENCKHFTGNERRRTGSRYEFFLYDPEKQQKAALEKELLEMEMAIEAKNMDIVKAKKLAAFLGINPFDNYGFPKTDSGLRQELMLFAKRNPLVFKKNLDSKEVEISFLIRAAIQEAKIDIGGSDGNMRFANGRTICKLPMSRHPLEYLTELAMTNSDEGRRLLEELERISK